MGVRCYSRLMVPFMQRQEDYATPAQLIVRAQWRTYYEEYWSPASKAPIGAGAQDKYQRMLTNKARQARARREREKWRKRRIA